MVASTNIILGASVNGASKIKSVELMIETVPLIICDLLTVYLAWFGGCDKRAQEDTLPNSRSFYLLKTTNNI